MYSVPVSSKYQLFQAYPSLLFEGLTPVANLTNTEYIPAI